MITWHTYGLQGPAGGVQCLESSSVMLHCKYVKDRVVRIRGEASPMLPWPTESSAVDQGGEAGDDASVQNSVGEAPAD